MKPIIITGCQRSGTAYIAALITASGYWCSHERSFRELEQHPLRPDTIEASWSAAPFLASVDAHVVHQIRHPLRVAASCLARSTFAGAGRRSARWAARMCSHTHAEGDDELRWVLRFWLEWNRLVAAHAHYRWRIEDLPADMVAQVLSECGRPVDAGRVAAAADLLPPRINQWTHVDTLTWDDVPDGKLKRRVREAAQEWGYDA